MDKPILKRMWTAVPPSRMQILLTLTVVLAVSSARAQVVGGSCVPPRLDGELGLVAVNGCSGVMLNKEWVLTAGHCVDPRNPALHAISATWSAGVSFSVERIYRFGGGRNVVGAGLQVLDFSDGPDLALLHLRTPLSIAGVTTDNLNRLYKRPLSEFLPGISLEFYGRGGKHSIPANCSTIGFMQGDFSLHTVDSKQSMFTVLENPSATEPGDSGGPYFIRSNNSPFLVGIHCCRGGIVEVNGIERGTSSGFELLPHHDWIRAVMVSMWDSSKYAQTNKDLGGHYALLSSAEVSYAPHGFSQLASTSWARASRSANQLCVNRGFVGGFYDGNEADGPLYKGWGVVCLGPGNLWQDATSQQVRMTPYGFDEVETVHWAQAARAANKLCSDLQFTGGLFTGYSKEERRGLICVGRIGTKDSVFFDPTNAELSQTSPGWFGGDINGVPWHIAAAAGNGYCRYKGYEGGFMTGHQVGENRGVVCTGPGMKAFTTLKTTKQPPLRRNR